MIPKIIHLCWFSEESFHVEIKICLASWKRILPDYTIRLWTYADALAIGCDYVSEALSVKKWAFAADVIRFYAIYKEGGIYLQSLSSMLPPLFLGPKAGESVLDMAAAPGGKTTQMAAMTGNQAQITACEKNKARSEKLKYNLEKQGASGTCVMVEDARKLDDFFSFDRILLDAPCSGSGTVEVRDGVCRTKISKELVERSARTQEELLKKALKLLKSGHEMVYSTCSILKEENEVLLKRVLKSAGGELVPIGEEWTKELPLLPNAMPGTLLVGPNELFEGFFVAKIRKK